MSAALALSLDPPWRVAAATLTVRGVARPRSAVRIRLHDGAGGVGHGEALPLAGYSADDADVAEHALGLLAGPAALHVASAAALGGAGGPGSAAALLEAVLAPHAALLSGAPSARFALECALLDLLARRAGLSAAHWLAQGRALQPVPVSALLPEDAGPAVAAATRAVRAGHHVLKLKIARADRSAAQEHALLAAVRAAADAAAPADIAAATPVLLRLDANGTLEPRGAPARLAELQRHGVELVEEPVAGADLLALPPLPLRWAADESLADAALAAALLALPPDRRPAALVLKPALLGLARCLALADAAAACGVGLIVTHAMDADLGLAAARALAAALPVPPWPCGLAPHPGLRHPGKSLPWLALPTAPGLDADDALDAAAGQGPPG
ncbi:MAG: O-succinylbenzoate synthase [Betaproteobacteria bacterium]|nr:O-succinylbenzoate synthase [Betaproteobacteria bacterium]